MIIRNSVSHQVKCKISVRCDNSIRYKLKDAVKDIFKKNTINTLLISLIPLCGLPLSTLSLNATAGDRELNLSNVPIGAGSIEKAKVYFLVDDSGSMGWESVINPTASKMGGGTFLDTEGNNFDWPGDTVTERLSVIAQDWRIVCNCFNRIYFDPRFNYSAWEQDNRPLLSSIRPNHTTLINNNNAFQEVLSDFGGEFIFTQLRDPDDFNNGNVPPDPAQSRYFKYKVTNTGLYKNGNPADATAEFGATNFNAFKRNIGIWYVLNRTRSLVAQRAMMAVVKEHDQNFIFGIRSTNGSITNPVAPSGVDTNNLVELKDHNQSVLKNYLTSVQSAALRGRTPLRQGLEEVGTFFTSNNAFDSSCQKAFTMTFTDGFWNSSVYTPRLLPSNYDDGDGIKTTFSDIAHYLYHTDLDNNNNTNKNTPSFNDRPGTDHQHLYSYVVAFGLKGHLDRTPGLLFPKKDRNNRFIPELDRDSGYGLNWGDPEPEKGRGAAGPDRVDDMWHAAYNSHGIYLTASSSQDAEDQLKRAMDFAFVESQSFEDTYLLSGIDIGYDKEGQEVMVSSFFNPAHWTGDVKVNKIDADGKIGDLNYSLRDLLASAPHFVNSNHIYTSAWNNNSGSSLVKMTMPSPSEIAGTITDPAKMSDEMVDTVAKDFQRYQLNSFYQSHSIDYIRSTFKNEIHQYGNQLIAFLRGKRNLESTATQQGLFRPREGILGDIIKSSPIIVGKPSRHYRERWSSDGSAPEDQAGAEKYSEFTYNNRGSERKPTIYFGANDGFLHSINLDDGKHNFIFSPDFLFDNLPNIAHRPYIHQYFHDGGLAVGDVFYDDKWHTVLVANTGFGAQGLYALDITDPDPNKVKFLWSFTDQRRTNMPSEQRGALGYSDGTPLIARFHNGKWGAVFSNGFNNNEKDGARVTSASVLGKSTVTFIVDIETGNVMARLQSPPAAVPAALKDSNGNFPTNGATRPTLVDYDNDDIIDSVIVGGLYGNLSYFSVDKDAFSATGQNIAGRTIFQTPEGQPILTRPEVSRHPNRQDLMIYFGTGRLATFEDANPTSQPNIQRFYAIHHDLSATSGAPLTEAKLTRKYIVAEGNPNSVDEAFRTVSYDNRSLVSPDSDGNNRGWYLELTSPATDTASGNHRGERVVVDPIYRNGMIMFPTSFPSAGTACSTSNFEGWLMVLDAKNGNNALLVDPTQRSSLPGGVDRIAGRLISTGTSAFSNFISRGGYSGSDRLFLSQEDGGVINTISLEKEMMFQRQGWRALGN